MKMSIVQNPDRILQFVFMIQKVCENTVLIQK